MTFVYDFSWVMYWQLSQEKIEDNDHAKFGGGGRAGRANEVHYGGCANGEFSRFNLPDCTSSMNW